MGSALELLSSGIDWNEFDIAVSNNEEVLIPAKVYDNDFRRIERVKRFAKNELQKSKKQLLDEKNALKEKFAWDNEKDLPALMEILGSHEDVIEQISQFSRSDLGQEIVGTEDKEFARLISQEHQRIRSVYQKVQTTLSKLLAKNPIIPPGILQSLCTLAKSEKTDMHDQALVRECYAKTVLQTGHKKKEIVSYLMKNATEHDRFTKLPLYHQEAFWNLTETLPSITPEHLERLITLFETCSKLTDPTYLKLISKVNDTQSPVVDLFVANLWKHGDLDILLKLVENLNKPLSEHYDLLAFIHCFICEQHDQHDAYEKIISCLATLKALKKEKIQFEIDNIYSWFGMLDFWMNNKKLCRQFIHFQEKQGVVLYGDNFEHENCLNLNKVFYSYAFQPEFTVKLIEDYMSGKIDRQIEINEYFENSVSYGQRPQTEPPKKL